MASVMMVRLYLQEYISHEMRKLLVKPLIRTSILPKNASESLKLSRRLNFKVFAFSRDLTVLHQNAVWSGPEFLGLSRRLNLTVFALSRDSTVAFFTRFSVGMQRQ